MSGEDELIDRIQELESQMAFQDELHGQLNDIVARQDRDISLLKNQVTELVRRLRDMDDSLSGQQAGSLDEVPPHY